MLGKSVGQECASHCSKRGSAHTPRFHAQQRALASAPTETSFWSGYGRLARSGHVRRPFRRIWPGRRRGRYVLAVHHIADIPVRHREPRLLLAYPLPVVEHSWVVRPPLLWREVSTVPFRDSRLVIVALRYRSRAHLRSFGERSNLASFGRNAPRSSYPANPGQPLSCRGPHESANLPFGRSHTPGIRDRDCGSAQGGKCCASSLARPRTLPLPTPI